MPRIASPRPAEEHPPSRLSQAAAAEVATGVYLGQVTLDVNLYREAKAASALSDKEKQRQYESAKAQHMRDVQACQNYFQLSEFVFDTGSWLPSIAVAGKWLPVRLQILVALDGHFGNLKTVFRAWATDKPLITTSAINKPLLGN